jgi:hypothetical protein
MKNQSVMKSGTPQLGISRRCITPLFNVELAGLGYYLARTPQRVRDDLNVTAMVISGDAGKSVAFIALDLLYGSYAFVTAIRERIAAQTGLEPGAICINCSHSHNAPTASFNMGVGEMDSNYVQTVITATVDAVLDAWRSRVPARLFVSSETVAGLTFNRTRENGPLDTTLSVLRADTLDGKPLAIAFNFHSHLTAHLETDFRAVSRDWPGEVVDQLQSALPGVIAMYLQGTCGDVILSPEFNSTTRRFEPAKRITDATLTAWKNARPIEGASISWAVRQIALPTRRWTREEIFQDRDEALHRLKTGDIKDWQNGFARVIVTYPDRLPERYQGSIERTVAAVCRFGVEWTDAALPMLEQGPETIDTEVQAFRLGDVWFCAHSAELFSSLGLEVRRKWPGRDLFMLGYSNGALGYLPDAFDINRRSYAAEQSPKFTGKLPFTAESGKGMIDGLVGVMGQLA